MNIVFFVLGSALFLVLLFWGGPGYSSARSFQQAWNLGHIACFFFWAYALGTTAWFKGKSSPWQWFWTVFLTVTFGGAIELLQRDTHRMADLMDVARDLCGSLLALAWMRHRSNPPAGLERPVFLAAAVLATLAFCLPAAFAVIDETMAKKQFPLLADFESPFELSRWSSEEPHAITALHAFSGGHSLHVSLSTTPYSGIFLDHFPGNWQEYGALSFMVFNPSDEPLTLICRIHDQLHQDGEQTYADRFNRAYPIASGWNTLLIPLAEVAAAPKDRSMDLSRIRGVGLFATRLSAPRQIYLDWFRLVQ